MHDIATTNNYNKILNRIHSKIKTTARQQIAEQNCWIIIPDMMVGVPKYDHSLCVAYVIDKLQTNGFNVRYTHPNMLFISWSHWVPQYVREEIRKKTGNQIYGFGNLLNNNDNLRAGNIMGNNIGNNIGNSMGNSSQPKNAISKSTNNLVYNNDIIENFKKSLNI